MEDTSKELLSDNEFKALKQEGEMQKLPANTLIFKRGDLAKQMYLVIEGRVELYFESGHKTKTIESGEIFGELSFILGTHLRSASARTICDTTLVVINEDHFNRITIAHPLIIISIFQRSCRYLLSSEQSLRKTLIKKNLQLQQTLDYLRATREELDYQELLAKTDELTGLFNRRCLEEQLQKFVQRACRRNLSLGLIMIDLDGFKPINDKLGHLTGDQVLKDVGRILKRFSRKIDLPCRIGGDEFAVLLPEFNAECGPDIGDGIREAIEKLHIPDNIYNMNISASIGGTMYHKGEDESKFMDRADKNLYAAKNEGKNLLIWKY